MKKFLLPIFVLILFSMNIGNAFSASNLEISTTENFSAPSTNFSGGQTIFVRLASSLPNESESRLNLRDNKYEVINSFPLKKDGGYFKATVPAPYNASYYSIEAIIKNGDSNTTSVKTIKVGNPATANVRVNVNSSSGGSTVLGESGGKNNGNQDNEVIEDSKDNGQDQQGVEGQYAWQKSDKSFGEYLRSIIAEIADFLWPF